MKTYSNEVTYTEQVYEQVKKMLGGIQIVLRPETFEGPF